MVQTSLRNSLSRQAWQSLNSEMLARLDRVKERAKPVHPEMQRCADDVLYFVNHYCYIYDVAAAGWIPFVLWPAQQDALLAMVEQRQVIILKARQIGMTWLALAYALWLMIFHPAATVLLFSRRDDEAIDLLDVRLKGMFQRLPEWMQPATGDIDSKHEFQLANGSRAKAFPTTAGDSYTASLVVGDEFDLVPDQAAMIRSVQPTIDNAGQMILLSRADKTRPQTRFKKLFRAAQQGLNEWYPVFLPWGVHPNRDAAWYARKTAEIASTEGTLDDLHEQYPASVEEALARSFGDLIYQDFSSENIRAVNYHPDWTTLWGVDDGYARGDGPGNENYHPRVILVGQVTPQGGLNILYEYYRCGVADYQDSITDGRDMLPKALPALALVDSSAAMFRGALHNAGISTLGATHKVGEGIKNVRRLIRDAQGVRLLTIHPRCEQLIQEMQSYMVDKKSTRATAGEQAPLKVDDHGPDALRYMAHYLRGSQ